MAECKLVTYAFPEGQPYHHFGVRALTRCETHGLEVQMGSNVGLCHVGLIEKAADEAIAKIEMAIKKIHGEAT